MEKIKERLKSLNHKQLEELRMYLIEKYNLLPLFIEYLIWEKCDKKEIERTYSDLFIKLLTYGRPQS